MKNKLDAREVAALHPTAGPGTSGPELAAEKAETFGLEIEDELLDVGSGRGYELRKAAQELQAKADEVLARLQSLAVERNKRVDYGTLLMRRSPPSGLDGTAQTAQKEALEAQLNQLRQSLVECNLEAEQLKKIAIEEARELCKTYRPSVSVLQALERSALRLRFLHQFDSKTGQAVMARPSSTKRAREAPGARPSQELPRKAQRAIQTQAPKKAPQTAPQEVPSAVPNKAPRTGSQKASKKAVQAAATRLGRAQAKPARTADKVPSAATRQPKPETTPAPTMRNSPAGSKSKSAAVATKAKAQPPRAQRVASSTAGRTAGGKAVKAARAAKVAKVTPAGTATSATTAPRSAAPKLSRRSK